MNIHTHTTPEVLCIGQVLMDCIIKGWNSASYKERVQTADSVTLSPGGDAFNESVVLSRLGHSVQTVCVLGNDLAGDILTNLLTDSGICTTNIIRNNAVHTPIAPLLVDADGNRKSINAFFCLDDFLQISHSLFKKVQIVSLASLFRPPLTCPEIITKICRDAKASGAIVTADTKLPLQTPVTLDDIKEALSYIDYIFPNEEEARFYTKKKDYADMAEVFLNYGVKNVIIKTGQNGCFAKNHKISLSMPAFRVNAIDSTGAGDNFAAGFLSALLRGSSFKNSLSFASACAAICVQSVGATSGVQSRAQAEKFLSDTGYCPV